MIYVLGVGAHYNKSFAFGLEKALHEPEFVLMVTKTKSILRRMVLDLTEK